MPESVAVVSYLKRLFKIQSIEDKIATLRGSDAVIRSMQIDEGEKAIMILNNLKRIDQLKSELETIRKSHLSVD